MTERSIARHADRVPPEPRGAGLVERRLLAIADSSLVNVARVEAAAGSVDAAPSIATGEAYWIERGTVDVRVDGAGVRLGPGGFAYLAPGAERRIEVVEGPALYLAITAPARGALASTGDMKADWNRRAAENARYYIATTNWEDEDRFDDSGAREVALFFEGLEHLLGADKAALDIGCGIGRMDRHVAPRVGRLTGLDVSGEMVARARARLAALGNVAFVEGDGRTLRPLPDASFDLVFSHICFQHMPRTAMASYCREAHRVLKPGGSFLFQVPEAVSAAPPDPIDADTFEMRYYREADLRAALEAIGFAWCGARRHRVDAPTLAFDQLQVHVRRP